MNDFSNVKSKIMYISIDIIFISLENNCNNELQRICVYELILIIKGDLVLVMVYIFIINDFCIDMVYLVKFFLE